ncbi:MAG: DUF21 domain-containing protein [Saprospiraceae bacterium]|nr:DUF21 domain-containing protein [Saprospiraceae bacterium]
MDPDPFSNTYFNHFFSTFLLVSWPVLLPFVFLILLLTLLGIFMASQSAILSISSEVYAKQNSRAAKAFLFLKRNQRSFSSLILTCNTVVIICICFIVYHLLEQWFLPVNTAESNGIELPFYSNSRSPLTIAPHSLTVFSSILISSTLILLFREWMPKFFQLINPERLALFASIPLKNLNWILWPLLYPMVSIANYAEKRIQQRKIILQHTTKEDLDTAIDLALKKEKVNDKQVNILRGIINFNDVSTKQIMTPRTEIYGLDFNLPYHEVLNTVKECGFSRLPVYNEDFDQITGILYAKDLIAHLREDVNFEWQRLIRTDIMFVPESKKINELLDEFRQKHKHMAFVVDEYGGTNGLITLEDIMEEIVGEIKDEFDDQQEIAYVKLDSNNYLFEGKTLINDLCRILNLDTDLFELARGNADSIAGLFLEQTGEMPYKEQTLEIQNVRLTVTAVSKKRIEQIKVSLL